MVKNLKPFSANYKLHTTNYREIGATHNGRNLLMLYIPLPGEMTTVGVLLPLTEYIL